jgi:outer membrane PBP1 activator LpoA protein
MPADRRHAARRRLVGSIAALALLAAGLPALSAAQSDAASGEAAQGGSSGGTKPDANAGDAKREPMQTLRAGPDIALVLPTASATFGRAATAVKDGFVAAANRDDEAVTVVGHGDGELLAAFAKARASGARVIVGPLVRDDVKAIAAAGDESPTVLALNQPEDGTSLPPNMYTLALSIESDARQLARLARDAGVQTVAIVGSDSPLQKRFAAAFTDAWLALGGGPPATLRFIRSPDMLALIRRELARTPVDAAVLAVDGEDAVLVKPYLGTIAVYAASTVNDRQSPDALRDLEDLRFVEIPWLATPEAKAFDGIARPDLPNATLDRLYALGIDAFRVARLLAAGSVDRIELDGAIGRLTLEETRQFAREARPMQFRGGITVPTAGP